MKKTALIATVLLLLVASTLWLRSFFPRPQKEVANILRPILDARLRADDSSYTPGSPAREVEDRLSRLVQEKTAAADTASVILLDYFLGEHNGETQLCSVTSRGTRVLPLINQYRDHPAGLLKPQYVLLRLNRKERDFMYLEALQAIRSGQPYGCD